MTNNSKKVLNAMIKVAGEHGASTEFYLSADSRFLHHDPNGKQVYGLKDSLQGEMTSIIKELVQDGLLYYTLQEYNFKITQKGLYYAESRRKALFSFFLGSILTPIIVSVITTLLISFVSKLI